jgi:hypothetical protein
MTILDAWTLDSQEFTVFILQLCFIRMVLFNLNIIYTSHCNNKIIKLINESTANLLGLWRSNATELHAIKSTFTGQFYAVTMKALHDSINKTTNKSWWQEFSSWWLPHQQVIESSGHNAIPLYHHHFVPTKLNIWVMTKGSSWKFCFLMTM